MYCIEGVAMVAEEVKDPARTIPKGYISGILTLMLLAIGVMVLTGGITDWQQLTAIDYPPAGIDWHCAGQKQQHYQTICRHWIVWPYCFISLYHYRILPSNVCAWTQRVPAGHIGHCQQEIPNAPLVIIGGWPVWHHRACAWAKQISW